jgi:hypothetical protein
LGGIFLGPALALVGGCLLTLPAARFLGEPDETVFVIARSDDPNEFMGEAAAIVRSLGMRPNPGRATDPYGNTLYVLDARSGEVAVWIANTDAGTAGSPECQDRAKGGSYPDPGQFRATVKARSGLDPAQSRVVMQRVSAMLEASGHKVSSDALPCSQWVRREPRSNPTP